MNECIYKLGNEFDMEIYETSCDNLFQLIEGDLKDNNVVYCMYCGKKIKEVDRNE